MVWTVLIICVPRVYLGYHFPSDFVAGAILGVVLMIVLCRLIGRMRLPDRVVDFAAVHPVFYAIAFVLTFELALLFADLRHLMLDVIRLGHMLVA
jgi:undecaprenyl-diphosphatase